MSELLQQLHAQRKRGNFRVMTESGTNYYIELFRTVAGGMRVISDSNSLKRLARGTVGCACAQGTEPIIVVGSSLLLAERGSCLVHTSRVETIEPIEAGFIDSLLCKRCHRGYKPEGQTFCRYCHHITR